MECNLSQKMFKIAWQTNKKTYKAYHDILEKIEQAARTGEFSLKYEVALGANEFALKYAIMGLGFDCEINYGCYDRLSKAQLAISWRRSVWL